MKRHPVLAARFSSSCPVSIKEFVGENADDCSKFACCHHAISSALVGIWETHNKFHSMSRLENYGSQNPNTFQG